MAQFTQLGPELLDRIAARYGLTVAALTPLVAGTINSNFRLDTARGRLFLRINEGAGEKDVAWEADLVAFLADHGVATPRPVPTTDGASYAAVDGLLVTIFPWVDEAQHHEPPAPADCHAVGEALRRFHEAGAPMRRPSRYAFERIAERAAGLPAHLGAVVDDVRRELDALSTWRPPEDGVIHGDLFPDNVLFSGAAATLLDFEQAATGSFIYDLAVLVLSWCWHDGAFSAAHIAALRAGYGRPVADEELRAACRFGAVRFTVTRLTDVELDPRVAPAVRASKDYRAFWARLRALRPR